MSSDGLGQGDFADMCADILLIVLMGGRANKSINTATWQQCQVTLVPQVKQVYQLEKDI